MADKIWERTMSSGGQRNLVEGRRMMDVGREDEEKQWM
jgi:hypothetical protein